MSRHSLGSIEIKPKPATSAVIIFDSFHHGEPDGEFLIEGFPSRELAREYVTRRARDSIEELRTLGQSEKEIRKLWNAYGESTCVVGATGAWMGSTPGSARSQQLSSATGRRLSSRVG